MRLSSSQLEAFWVVAQTLNFHEASRRLFLTQPAVTQRIKELESAIGTSLFVRGGRRVGLTEAGRILLDYCKTHAESEDLVLEEIRSAQHGLSGMFAIASGSALMRPWLLRSLMPLIQDHLALNLTLIVQDQIDVVSTLRTQRADLVITWEKIGMHGFQSEYIGDEEIVLIAPPDADIDNLESMRLIDFDERDRLTRDFIQTHLPSWTMDHIARSYINDDFGLIEMVKAGAGISAVPLHLVANDLASGALLNVTPGRTTRRPIYLVSIHTPTPSRRMRAIVDQIKRCASQILLVDKVAGLDVSHLFEKAPAH